MDVDNTGGYFLSKWEHKFSDASDLSLKFYYERTDLIHSETFVEIRDTFGFNLQNNIDTVLNIVEKISETNSSIPIIVIGREKSERTENKFIYD